MGSVYKIRDNASDPKDEGHDVLELIVIPDPENIVSNWRRAKASTKTIPQPAGFEPYREDDPTWLSRNLPDVEA